MPYSFPGFKDKIRLHFEKNIPRDSKILDVGPGAGTYASLLRPAGFKLDCIEIYEPYVHQFELHKLYDKVNVGNIMEFDFQGYDYILMGDILEHLTTKHAKELLAKIAANNIKCLVAVPFLLEQGEQEGNTYETHLQPDLTPGVMKIRYPDLVPIYRNGYYGYYINYSRLSFLDKVKFVVIDIIHYAKKIAKWVLGRK